MEKSPRTPRLCNKYSKKLNMRCIHKVINMEPLIKNIINIYDNDAKYEFNKIECIEEVDKYSSLKTKVSHLYIDGNKITRRSLLKFEYKCITCESTSIVSSLSIIRKINSSTYNQCYYCRNKDETKRQKHSTWMTGRNIREKKEIEELITKSYKILQNEALAEFDNHDEEYKKKYFNSHITSDEMKRLQPKIVSIDNINQRDLIDKLEYWPIYYSLNQMKFTSVFYDPINNRIIKGTQPIVIECEVCKLQSNCKHIHKYKRQYKILCHNCKLCRKTFKIRSYITKFQKNITYQSKQEKDFIDWCEENNIIIENGPNIEYIFEGKKHIYRVDFLLSKLNYLIEIKDNHIWHQKQIESGKWAAKEDAVFDQINNNVYSKYLMITPQNKEKMLENLQSKI